MSEKKIERTHMLFLGLRRNMKDEKRYAWIILGPKYENDGPLQCTDANVILYDGKPWLKGLRPGSIIAIDRSVEPDDIERCVIYPETAILVDRWEEDEQVAEWEAYHEAVTLAFDSEGAAAKKNKERLDLACLDPIREAYWSLPRRQQKALLVNILLYLETPPK